MDSKYNGDPPIANVSSSERQEASAEDDAQRRLQTLLYEREREHLAINQHAIVSITDARGVITYVNDKFCQVSGYPAEQLLGQNHRILKSGVHSAAFYQDLWRTVVQGKVWQGELCNQRADGTLYWVASTITPFLDTTGKPYQYISIRTDITSLKAAEQALKEQSERLRLGQMYANIGIWEWNVQTGDLFWSERIPSLFGYADGALHTSYDSFLAAIHPDDRPAVRAAVDACLADDTPYAIEHRVVWPDGTVRWLQEKGAVSRDADGRPLRMLGAVQDIDERKRAEIAMEEAKLDAERANQSKSDFLSSMSHELRTPLNAILGFAELIGYDGTLSDDNRDNLNEVRKAGKHLLHLVNEVLDLTKVEAGRMTLSFEPVPLGGLLKECLELMRPLARARHLEVELDVPEDLVFHADRVRFKQALLNVLSNAIKYNHDGGSIGISAFRCDQGRCCVKVADTGMGIPASDIERIFEPFQRLGAECGTEQGSGIGLTFTRRIIECMQGRIHVSSVEGEGSQFTIELPSADPTGFRTQDSLRPECRDDRVSEPNELTLPTPGEYQVLYIEDNPANLKLVAQILQHRSRISLQTAHTPQLGLELIRYQQPDLILLDINLPTMNGYDVLARLREEYADFHVSVIALTANAMPQDIERGMAAGFAAYLTKPLDIGELLSVIDKLLVASTAH